MFINIYYSVQLKPLSCCLLACTFILQFSFCFFFAAICFMCIWFDLYCAGVRWSEKWTNERTKTWKTNENENKIYSNCTSNNFDAKKREQERDREKCSTDSSSVFSFRTFLRFYESNYNFPLGLISFALLLLPLFVVPNSVFAFVILVSESIASGVRSEMRKRIEHYDVNVVAMTRK